MTKYLRQILISSRVPAFVRMGYRDLRKKFHVRYHTFRAGTKEWLGPQLWLWMKQTCQ